MNGIFLLLLFMGDKDYDEILELLYRIQTNQNPNIKKQEFIKVKIGENKYDINFPIQHLLYLPRKLLDPIHQHIYDIKRISFDFMDYDTNKFIYNYFSKRFYEDIFTHWEETINVWHAFNKNKQWGYNEPISDIEQCIKKLEKKWENGIDDFEKEIQYIKDKI